MPVIAPSGEDRSVPLHAFAFHVSFDLPAFARIDKPLLGGFTDVTGLEASMEARAIPAGGRNYGPVQRAGPVTFSTVVLKRGVVESRHLWQWFAAFAGAPPAPGASGDAAAANGAWGMRGDVTVTMLRGAEPVFGWVLRRAMPVKFRAGDLNAQSGELAVEELHLAHEGLEMEVAS
ncbi:phage tail protein [Albimonas sp. CAU 1670]|uniref:phage tail protein n=1 Tax=Albimonas sp. CAU 1670 TaxID=3032599 RepID=UPI0023DC76EC|nr:phage tail protein [Albimonas sp. CAU 1670]MDF2235427.1 phage tail protein [Albimonas sp. CAU 1670]